MTNGSVARPRTRTENEPSRGASRAIVAAALLIVATVAAPQHALAATFVVDRTDDVASATACSDTTANDCSLRGAIAAANAAAGSTVVVPAGQYFLTTSGTCAFTSRYGTSFVGTTALCVRVAMTVAGAGASTTTVDGGNLAEVFMVGQGGEVVLSGLTIQHGLFNVSSLYGSGGAINSAASLTLDGCVLRDNVSVGSAGAIYNSGALTVRRSTIANNTAGGSHSGGAIFSDESTRLDIIDSTISGNSCGNGGGGVMNYYGTLTVSGSTISGNTAGTYAGGVWNLGGSMLMLNSTISGNANSHSYGGGFWNTGTAELRNVTITGNRAGSASGNGLGGGIASTSGTLRLANTIVAGNTATYFSAVDAGPDCYATVSSLGHNLIGFQDAKCVITGDTTGNLGNVDAKLGPLTDNGGATDSHALLPGSAAIDAGDPAAPGSGDDACPAFDQRGFLRPAGASCDIGAVEKLPGFAIYAATPDRGGNGGSVVAHVAGDAFDDGATVRLRRAGQSDIVGSPVTVDGGGAGLTTAFDLTGAVLGAWDVVVDNPGATATLAGAFIVESAEQPDLWVTVIGPRGIRAGVPASFQVAYGNRGNVDALAVPLTLSFGPGIVFRPAFPLAAPPAQTGQLVLDWTLQDLTVDVGANAATNVPLLLPVVPAGFAGSLEILLTLPASSPHGAEFTTLAALGEPLLTPLSDPAAIATSVAGARAYASANFDYTLPDALTPALAAYAQAQLAAIVADGRARLITDVGNPPPVSSLAWLGIDLALYGTGQVLEPNAPLARLIDPLRVLRAIAWPADAIAETHTCPVTPCKGGGVLAPGCACTDITCDRSSGNGSSLDSGCYPPPIPAPPGCNLSGRLSTSEFLENLKNCKITRDQCEALPKHRVVTNDDGSVFCVPSDDGKHCPKIAIPNPLGAGSLDCIGTPIKLSHDPNDKTGVVGAGVKHAIVPGTPLPYTIRFENDAAQANAAAQVVTITDQLDPAKVDLASFSLGPISFGSIRVPMPPGIQEYRGGVDLRPAQNLLVLIHAAIDLQTGLVGWEFTSVDPDTQELTTDPDAGFLPPNVTSPEGEGAVSFTVNPKDGLPDDTEICNGASIVFDVNDAILTPEWCNTVDQTPPTSAVATLPATSPASFDVTWSGSDAGAGIASYTIYVSTDGGPFTALVSETDETTTTFNGQIGSSYAFYSVARDLVGNQEGAPAGADTQTTVVASGDAADLAITKLVVPKTAVLTAKKRSVAKTVTVQIQNRGATAVTIPDAAAAASLVQVTAESLGTCPAPAVTLRASKIKKPIVLKPKRKATLFFDVSFDCASFPGKSSSKTPGLEDDRYAATVTLSALGGAGDAHPVDDVCPRQVTAPGVVDPFPDGTIRDPGCGTKRPDKTFGDPVLTDVVDKAPR